MSWHNLGLPAEILCTIGAVGQKVVALNQTAWALARIPNKLASNHKT
jgi:hypothetical protein